MRATAAGDPISQWPRALQWHTIDGQCPIPNRYALRAGRASLNHSRYHRATTNEPHLESESLVLGCERGTVCIRLLAAEGLPQRRYALRLLEDGARQA